MDDAPFQINPLGVQVKQLHRTEPPVDENLFSGTNSETLPSFTQDLSECLMSPPSSILVLHWLRRKTALENYLTQTEDASFTLSF